MSLIPDKKVEKIEFAESHNAAWTASAVAIGTTSAAVSALGSLTVSARSAYNTQIVAQEAAKTAVDNADIAVKAMTNAAADIIKSIRAKAAVSGDSIWTLAALPIPPVPGPVPAPGTPSNFNVQIREDGALMLKWKCTNPENATGTIYQVSRKLATDTDFVILGGTGTKSFIDAALPSNSSPVTYRVIGQRSTVFGLPAQFTVSFGTDSGSMTASIVAPRMAA